jgi:hypothetical protein
LNCARHGGAWNHGLKDGIRAGTEDIIDSCPAPGSPLAADFCRDTEYALHKCPVSCQQCSKSQIETITVTQTTMTATTATATTDTATTTTTLTTETKTTGTKTTETGTTHTTTQTTLTFTDSVTTLTETTVTETTATHTTATETTETGTTQTVTTTTTVTGTTATITQTTATDTTNTFTTQTKTTITLTTTTLGPATFPIYVENEEKAQDLFYIIKQVLNDNCFPDNVFEEAYNDDRLRLEEVESGKRYIWDGGVAPPGAVYPMLMKIWVDESLGGCAVPTDEPVSSTPTVAPLGIVWMIMLYIWIPDVLLIGP